jgi:hypothetical protein
MVACILGMVTDVKHKFNCSKIFYLNQEERKTQDNGVLVFDLHVGSRTRDRSKGEPGLVEKDIRSSGSGDLQPGKKEVLTISDQPRGKTKKSSLLHLTPTE